MRTTTSCFVSERLIQNSVKQSVEKIDVCEFEREPEMAVLIETSITYAAFVLIVGGVIIFNAFREHSNAIST